MNHVVRLPQIRSTARNLLAIAGITVCCGVFNASAHGEIHKWSDLLQALRDGLLYGVVTAFGWLGMQSPIAKYVQELLQSETTKTTIGPSGAVTMEKKVTTVPLEAHSSPPETK